MTTDKIRKDKNQNIQVFIRLRPLNQRERDIKSLGVIEVVNNREVVVRHSQQTSLTKKFTFDRAFNPSVNQLQVYQEVVSPLIEEVLNGYNCTVFAYGQTGTGKTHTMVGEHSGSDTHWQDDPLAGIIPRALSQLFDELRLSNTEYTVRVSYLELYNEELFDLLSTSEDNSKLRIYEDVTRKGSNIVNGLEEITVYNKNEVYKIMSQGQERKRVASTLMNAQSSRSHTVFTILVHMKENSAEGEELVKIGKLNLVDLAGSENISKAGSDNPAKKERARECVNINQSLLTLGRVITALVERHPHIPYRESKLTRILQESLGGRTKTSIIATISPGHKDLEETMSTLEYAHRAKNIQNKPEVNQKMTKKAILKEYSEEIDRLKRDLQASRDKTGVYLASETYAEMTIKDEEQRKEIQELLIKKKAMEDERDRMEGVFAELNNTLETKNKELDKTVTKLKNTKEILASTTQQLNNTLVACEEKQHLVEAHLSTEQKLSVQARELLATADVATKHVHCLHESVDKRKTLESTNLEITKTYREESEEQRHDISAKMFQFTTNITNALNELHTALGTFTSSSTQSQEENKQHLEHLAQKFLDFINQIKSSTSEQYSSLVNTNTSAQTALHTSADEHHTMIESTLNAILHSFAETLKQVHGVDVKGNIDNFVQQWYRGASARVSSLRRAHSDHEARSARRAHKVKDTYHKQRDGLRNHVDKAAQRIHTCQKEMQEELSQLKECLAEQLSEIETEQQETESILQEWMAKERKLLEDRLAEHATTVRNMLEVRQAKKIAKLEEQKKMFEERMERYNELYEKHLQEDKNEVQIVENDLDKCVSLEEESAKDMKKFDKDFEDGVGAINIDIEVFSKNVVEVVDHLSSQVMQLLEQIRTHMEQQVSTVISQDDSSYKQFVQDVDSALASHLDTTKHIIDEIVNNVETTNNIAVKNINDVTSSTTQNISFTLAHLTEHSSQCNGAQSLVNNIQEELTEAIEKQANLEAKYLSQEYKLYTPTGKTPSRVEYRYPRNLVATSPHDRILARFRALRQLDDDECMIVESDSDVPAANDSDNIAISHTEQSLVSDAEHLTANNLERPITSDSDSQRCTESPKFVTPILPHGTPNPPQMLKSTSDADILYTMKRQNEQGKENTERSFGFKKPSKLPAPSSHKKPLMERNVN